MAAGAERSTFAKPNAMVSYIISGWLPSIFLVIFGFGNDLWGLLTLYCFFLDLR
jgi:hypothetical protein